MIIDLLNKIKFSERIEDFRLYYQDRFTKNLLELDFRQIEKINPNSVIIIRKGQMHHIHAHRIREIKNNGILIWKA